MDLKLQLNLTVDHAQEAEILDLSEGDPESEDLTDSEMEEEDESNEDQC